MMAQIYKYNYYYYYVAYANIFFLCVYASLLHENPIKPTQLFSLYLNILPAQIMSFKLSIRVHTLESQYGCLYFCTISDVDYLINKYFTKLKLTE